MPQVRGVLIFNAPTGLIHFPCFQMKPGGNATLVGRLNSPLRLTLPPRNHGGILASKQQFIVVHRFHRHVSLTGYDQNVGLSPDTGVPSALGNRLELCIEAIKA